MGNTMDSKTLLEYLSGNVKLEEKLPIPISGGSVFATQQFFNMLSSPDMLPLWLLYKLNENYFVNLTKIEGDEDLKDIWNLLVKTSFRYGTGALTKLGDKLCVMGLVNPREGVNGKITKSDGIIAYSNVGFSDDQKQRSLTDKTAVFTKFYNDGYPSIIYLYTFIKSLLELLKSSDTTASFLVKKILIKIKNNSSDALSKELRSIFDNTTPYVFNISNETDEDVGVPNAIEGMKDFGSADVLNIWDAIDKLMRFWYHQLGRRYNVNDKKERNTSKEVDINTAQFDVLEYEWFANLENVVRDYNKMFNKNAKLVVIMDAIAEKEQERDDKQDVSQKGNINPNKGKGGK